jgi:hypothetical protein
MLAVALALILTQQPTGVAQQVFEVVGQVDRIDRSGRLVTISGASGAAQPIWVGPDLPIFDQIARGDLVVVRYYDAYIVEVTPGTRMNAIEDTTAAAKDAVKRGDADVMQQLRLVVTIDAIDPATQSVTYHGADNRRVFRVVQYPQLLQGVKVGDVVTITYTRARAVSVEKKDELKVQMPPNTTSHPVADHPR